MVKQAPRRSTSGAKKHKLSFLPSFFVRTEEVVDPLGPNAKPTKVSGYSAVPHRITRRTSSAHKPTAITRVGGYPGGPGRRPSGRRASSRISKPHAPQKVNGYPNGPGFAPQK